MGLSAVRTGGGVEELLYATLPLKPRVAATVQRAILERIMEKRGALAIVAVRAEGAVAIMKEASDAGAVAALAPSTAVKAAEVDVMPRRESAALRWSSARPTSF